MVVTVSGAVLFGLLTFAVMRGRLVGPGAAAVLFLFGFFVAGTGASGPINDICRSLADTVTHLN
ncbi:hypothetical protein [Streptomyces sp. SCSIO ZS0520]|uniref:hypothetical protein n=1 Tax=Streptomyces sp. SCSIO ZS0520 TaxID=2892996 RepID=UPI0021D84C6A|nr:hypothetical protein [Streptomyces sp. SCSIO ZS0520]